ncbi:MAG: T9SS type A sorting domain-containing protein [Salibacteraceae bacterium]
MKYFYRIIVALLVLLVSNTSVEAASVNNIQRGSVSLTGTSITVTLCDSVIKSSSILIFSMSNNSNSVGGCLVRGILTNENTLTFTRAQTNGTPIIEWTVIEYSSGVTVEHGSTNVDASTKDQAITAVGNLSNSFPIITMSNNGSTWGNDDGVVAELTSTSNLQFRCSNSNFDVNWQIVQYDSCSVESFSSSLTGASSTASITAVDTLKSIIIGSHYQSGNINADDMPRVEFADDETITLTRVGSASTLTYFGYAIEFTDNTTVEHGNFSFASGSTTDTETINAIATDRSLVMGTSNAYSQGSTPYSSDDNCGYNWSKMEFPTTTSVLGTRATSGNTANIPFQVVSFRYNQTRIPSGSVADVSDPTGPFDSMFLNRLEKNTVTMGAGATSVTATIASVNRDSTFMLFSIRVNTNEIGQGLVRGEITNGTTLTFERDASGSAVEIDYQVFYFASGVYVQHGTTNLTSTSVSQSISSVDLNKSFVIATLENDGSTFGEDDGVTADLTTTTNIQFNSNTTISNDVNWQVVQMQDALVRKINFSLNNGSTSTTTSISSISGSGSCASSEDVNGVLLNRTFIVANHYNSGAINSDDIPRVELTDTNEITAKRVGTSSTLNFLMYAVELFDSSVVQHGSVTITGTSTSNTGTFAAVEEIASGYIPPGNLSRQGSSTYTSNDELGLNWATYNLSSPTEVTITRGSAINSTSVFPYQIISFNNFSNPPLPVELGEFNAVRNQDQIDLDWNTFSEINNNYFIIERSLNGSDFEAIGKIAGNGTTNVPQQYYYTDYDYQPELIYYRLKQVDFDGNFEYHPVKLVAAIVREIEGPTISIFPNPTRHVLNIKSNLDLYAEIHILNTKGNVLLSFETDLTNQAKTFNLQGLTNGVYIVSISTTKGLIHHKLIVENP